MIDSNVSKKEWEQKVERDLKGKELSSLNWSLDGMVLDALYHQDDITESIQHAARSDNQWNLGVILDVDDYASANAMALEVLNAGANALWFSLPSIPSLSRLDTLLRDIRLDWIISHFETKDGLDVSFYHTLSQWLHQQNIQPSQINVTIDIAQESNDVIRRREVNRLSSQNIILHRTNENSIALLANYASELVHKINDIAKDADDVSSLFRSSKFVFHTRDHYFANIAMIRAWKAICHQILRGYGVPVEDPKIAVIVDAEGDDKDMNKISQTAHAMSAVIGGVDELYIRPSDIYSSGGSVFSRRIALNVQHILQYESYMAQVVDPAAGSYFVESLTQSMAQEAWSLFQSKIINQ